MTDTTTAERRPQATRGAAHEVQATTPDDTTVTARPEPPTIAVERVSQPDKHGNRTVTVRCPYCHGRHLHGLPVGDDTTAVGHRLAHCSRDVAHLGYVIAGTAA